MSSYVTKKTLGDTEWFEHDRFGMFIHWGLYAMPARNEWIKHIECQTDEIYDKYFKYGNLERTQLTEFNSNNTALLTVEEVKQKLLTLSYIREELDKLGIKY